MDVNYFVKEDSIVRTIWSKADTILFIFAGASAEFALNKAVDWLYFTGRLPADPIGRLFSTVTYARKIIFAENKDALAAIDEIASIHRAVEEKRGFQIPDWAYRDVLYMLIDYSIRSFEVLERRLTDDEKEELFDVFRTVGVRLGITLIPETLQLWQNDRLKHLSNNLALSDFTKDLYKQYNKHLGGFRYTLLVGVQSVITPYEVKKLMSLRSSRLIKTFIAAYKLTRKNGIDKLLKKALLPRHHKTEFDKLEHKFDAETLS